MSPLDKFVPGGLANPDDISFEDLSEALESEACALVDVREPYEFDEGHAPGAINMPMSTFDPASLPSGKPVVLICRSGVRTARALALARAAGVTGLRHFRGGMLGWANSGGEVV